MVLGFNGGSFTSICASEDSHSLMGESTIVNCVQLVVDCHYKCQGAWVRSAGWVLLYTTLGCTLLVV